MDIVQQDAARTETLITGRGVGWRERVTGKDGDGAERRSVT